MLPFRFGMKKYLEVRCIDLLTQMSKPAKSDAFINPCLEFNSVQHFFFTWFKFTQSCETVACATTSFQAHGILNTKRHNSHWHWRVRWNWNEFPLLMSFISKTPLYCYTDTESKSNFTVWHFTWLMHDGPTEIIRIHRVGSWTSWQIHGTMCFASRILLENQLKMY